MADSKTLKKTTKMMSKCRKCHLRETKFAKFPGGGGGACPQIPLEARAVGARLSAFGAKRASLFLLKRGWNVCKNSNNHNLRKSLNVALTRPETELGRRSFVHRSAIAWNAPPDNLKDSTNPSIFKHNVKRSKQTILNINFGKGGNVIYNMKPDFYYY